VTQAMTSLVGPACQRGEGEGRTDSVGVPEWAVGRLLAWAERLPRDLFYFFDTFLFLFSVFQK
jgi:hypothetical protein